MLIEISQEEYLKLQKIRLRNELLLSGILKYAELDYYGKELSFYDEEICKLLDLLYPEDYHSRIEYLNKLNKLKEVKKNDSET